MRYIYTLIFFVMILALSACSSTDETKKIVETKLVEEKESGVIPEVWEGEWIFLSDESVGHLQISNVVDQQFDYKIGATEIRGLAETSGLELTSFASEWEGTGVINFNEATASNKYIEECKLKFILDKDQMLIESMDESCQSDIKLTGSYKKKDSIETEPFWGINDQAFYISGITLGMSAGQVKAVLANPDYEGPDSGYYSWRQDYPNLSIGYDIYTNNEILSINATVEKEDLKELLVSTTNLEHYEGDENTLYYYAPKSRQLLILKEFNENQEIHDILLTHQDENFLYHVEAGSIRKVE